MIVRKDVLKGVGVLGVVLGNPTVVNNNVVVETGNNVGNGLFDVVVANGVLNASVVDGVDEGNGTVIGNVGNGLLDVVVANGVLNVALDNSVLNVVTEVVVVLIVDVDDTCVVLIVDVDETSAVLIVDVDDTCVVTETAVVIATNFVESNGNVVLAVLVERLVVVAEVGVDLGYLGKGDRTVVDDLVLVVLETVDRLVVVDELVVGLFFLVVLVVGSLDVLVEETNGLVVRLLFGGLDGLGRGVAELLVVNVADRIVVEAIVLVGLAVEVTACL